MLITWMAYATLVGAAVSVAALATEQIVAIWNGARRTVWIVALGVAITLPFALALSTHEKTAAVRPSRDVQRVTIDGSMWSSHAAVAESRAPRVASLQQSIARIDTPMPIVWLAASVLFLCAFLRADWMLRGRRSEWRTAIVDGHSVLVARDVGPAVVGALRAQIVFPEWALALDANERMLMLKHEREHVAARDPLLLLCAALALICFPWNAGLWFIAKRLRLAVEIDCDARVLRAVNRPREYGLLLLAVGARHTATLPYAASLVERTPLLERRIRAMTSVQPTHPVVTSMILAVVAIAATTLAAQAPRPKPFAVKLTNAESSRREILRRVDLVTVPASVSTASAKVVAPDVDSVRVDTPTVAGTRSTATDSNTSRSIPNWRASLSYTAKPAAPSTEPSVNPISRSAAAASADIPFPVIRDWIARYHPDIMSGQSTTALVTIIVDANDKYVSSTTDAAQTNPAGKIPVDSIASIDLLKGAAAIAAYGDSAANGVVVVTTKSGNGAATLANREFTIPKDRLAAGREVNTVSDLVRLRANATSPLPTTHPLFVIDGVVVDSPDPVARPSDQLDKLGVPSDGIQAVQVLRIRAGQIGPNALSVVVIKLKP